MIKPTQSVKRQLKRTLSTGDLLDPSESKRQLSVNRTLAHVALQIVASHPRVSCLLDADAASKTAG